MKRKIIKRTAAILLSTMIMGMSANVVMAHIAHPYTPGQPVNSNLIIAYENDGTIHECPPGYKVISSEIKIDEKSGKELIYYTYEETEDIINDDIDEDTNEIIGRFSVVKGDTEELERIYNECPEGYEVVQSGAGIDCISGVEWKYFSYAKISESQEPSNDYIGATPSVDYVGNEGNAPASGRILKGDVNGDGKVTLDDASKTLRLALALDNPAGPIETIAADMNNSSFVDMEDVTLVLKTALGIN